MQSPAKSSDQSPDKKSAEKPHGLSQISLKAAGMSFLVADLSLITSGFMSGVKQNIWAGVFGLSAGVVGSRYGNPKAEKRLEQIERRLGAYLRRQGVEIPKHPTTEALTKEGGVIDHIESFLYKYPSQVMNVFYSLIGVQFVGIGLADKGPLYKRPMLGSGLLLIAGALGGLLLQEKKPDPQHPPEGAFEKAKSWVQEKPLRATGILFNLNQLLLGKSAWDDRNNNLHAESFGKRNSYVAKAGAVAAFSFGNTMVALSSKSEGGATIDPESLAALSEASALVIAAQPKPMRDKLLEHVAGYLATEQSLNMDAQQISVMLHAKLDEVMQTYPVAGWQARAASQQAASLAAAR